MHIYKAWRQLGAVCLSALWLAGCGPAAQQEQAAEDSTAAASPQAQAASDAWVSLFDGSSLEQWRDYRGEGISWSIEDGTLTTPGGKGDIVTRDTYGDFELVFEWKEAAASNAGVMYLVQEGEHEKPYHTGPEYQIIDAEGYEKKNKVKPEPSQTTGANYGLQAPSVNPSKAVGSWNEGKIRVQQGQVEHWVNGQKVVAYELWTDDWKKQVSQTKFAEWPEYGMAKEGHIALQDHNDRIWFRNIRIRKL